MRENHQHLVSLGVSHPALESIKEKTATPYRLSTKLTGAGGGGCAVTLIPDGTPCCLLPTCVYVLVTDPRNYALPPDFKDEDLHNLIDTLIREGFEPYLTSVGGSGLGILSPYSVHRTRGGSQQQQAVPEAFGQVTPPETPTPHEENVSGEVDGSDHEPLRAPFASKSVTDLPAWTTSLGRWLYV